MVAPVRPQRRASGRKARSCASTWKAVFQRALQNSASDVARNGERMTGWALTPARCQARARRWNEPKCRKSTTPIIPSQPVRSGGRLKARRAATKISAAPARVFAAAKLQIPSSKSAETAQGASLACERRFDCHRQAVHRAAFGVWCLGFFWSLVLEVWSFEKRSRIHAGPGEEVGEGAGDRGMGTAAAGAAPGEPFAGEEDGQGEEPHKSPGGHNRAQQQHRGRHENQREPFCKTPNSKRQVPEKSQNPNSKNIPTPKAQGSLEREIVFGLGAWSFPGA